MELSDIAKRMIKVILIIALLCITGSIIYYRSLEFLPFFIGVILGSVASIGKAVLLDRAIDKALKMENKQAGKYLTIQNILRLLVSGLVLMIGALAPQVSIWGVAAGILAFPFATYSENFRIKKTSKGKEVDSKNSKAIDSMDNDEMWV